jgi:PleD family two-component response regulator
MPGFVARKTFSEQMPLKWLATYINKCGAFDLACGSGTKGALKLKKSIIYLDDDPGCLDVFQLTFDDEYEVRTATTPDEARRMLAERVADIVVSDQNIPAIKGEEFLR